MLSDTALKNIQCCIASIDEFINGKFVFAETIISKILNTISQSDEIYDLISGCMQNFNFEKELARAQVKLPTKFGHFQMPENRATVIALVFCLLVDIRDKKINLTELLNHYFRGPADSQYDNFSNIVLKPFKDCLMYCFDMDNQAGQVNLYDLDEQNKKQQQQKERQEAHEQKMQQVQNHIKQTSEENKKFELFFENIKKVCNQIICQISQEKKIKESIKDDCLYVIGCIIDNADKQDLNNVSALVVCGEYILKNVKSLRFFAKELRDQIIALYQ